MNSTKWLGALAMAVAFVAGCGGGDEGGQAGGKVNNGTVVAVSRELFIAVSRDSGATWTTVMHQPGLPEEQSLLVRASYVNGRYFAFGWRLFTSTDAVTFTELQAPIKEWYGEVVYGDGIFLTGGGFGQVITSTDGTTWTAAALIPGVPQTGIRSAAYGGGRFALADASGNVYVSADKGATWAVEPGLQTVSVGFCEGAFKDGAACGKSNASVGIWDGHGYRFRQKWPEALERSEDGMTFVNVGIIAPRDLVFGPPQ